MNYVIAKEFYPDVYVAGKLITKENIYWIYAPENIEPLSKIDMGVFIWNIEHLMIRLELIKKTEKMY